MVNHPDHYTRGPNIAQQHYPDCHHPRLRMLECIEVIRWIGDMRLANAVRYIWRVAFGGKENDRQDIEKAIWYLKDWLQNPLEDSGESQDDRPPMDSSVNWHGECIPTTTGKARQEAQRMAQLLGQAGRAT